MYLISEEERKKSGSTAYIEFQRIHDPNNFIAWKEDSLCIWHRTFDELGLNDIFYHTVPQYDFYGICEISKETWRKLVTLGKEHGGEIALFFEELTPFAESAIDEYGSFWFIGL